MGSVSIIASKLIKLTELSEKLAKISERNSKWILYQATYAEAECSAISAAVEGKLFGSLESIMHAEPPSDHCAHKGSCR